MNSLARKLNNSKPLLSWRSRKKDAITLQAEKYGVSIADIMDFYTTIGMIVDNNTTNESEVTIKTPGKCDLIIPVSEIRGFIQGK